MLRTQIPVYRGLRCLSETSKSGSGPTSPVPEPGTVPAPLTSAEQNYLKHNRSPAPASLDPKKHNPLRYLAHVKPKPVPKDINYYNHKMLLKIGDLVGRHGTGDNRRSNIVFLSVLAVVGIDGYMLWNWWYGEELQNVSEAYAEEVISRTERSRTN
ncbi:hypothetical protein BABINDRAFT_13920 [Babjeviella inositovora NRRL Y-12698]|uniref:Uncharacterized protein n=1 Tax=Babjeviella inositovora NRRL Y-12698 TaxID=984486 RepID=A0A1E3QPJ7_9ASCO|nr:uncharacterized protein BABINDRAFT_13920 [Babjeviella inositovora NRRL Y-12698]ODQ79615.1 hypothetical protein BABINDRAFT_13920 [Babjeviella inositovora NRRL Y-12698]